MTEREAIKQFALSFDTIGKTITNFMLSELIQQGHKATGKLAESIEHETQTLLDGLTTTVSYLDYGQTVNDGVPANKIPIGKSFEAFKFLTEIMNWVRFKGFAGTLDKDIKRVSKFIVRKMAIEGIPTKNSFNFSNNGRRTRWVDYTIDSKERYMGEQIENISYDFVHNMFWAKLEEITNINKGSMFFSFN
jgi:hypothetical protein